MKQFVKFWNSSAADYTVIVLFTIIFALCVFFYDPSTL